MADHSYGNDPSLANIVMPSLLTPQSLSSTHRRLRYMSRGVFRRALSSVFVLMALCIRARTASAAMRPTSCKKARRSGSPGGVARRDVRLSSSRRERSTLEEEGRVLLCGSLLSALALIVIRSLPSDSASRSQAYPVRAEDHGHTPVATYGSAVGSSISRNSNGRQHRNLHPRKKVARSFQFWTIASLLRSIRTGRRR